MTERGSEMKVNRKEGGEERERERKEGEKEPSCRGLCSLVGGWERAQAKLNSRSAASAFSNGNTHTRWSRPVLSCPVRHPRKPVAWRGYISILHLVA